MRVIASSIALAVLAGALVTAPAWSQGRSKDLDCTKTPGAAECVNPAAAAHSGTATQPGVTPITAARPPSPAPATPSDQPAGGENKPGHGGKGG